MRYRRSNPFLGSLGKLHALGAEPQCATPKIDPKTKKPIIKDGLEVDAKTGRLIDPETCMPFPAKGAGALVDIPKADQFDPNKIQVDSTAAQIAILAKKYPQCASLKNDPMSFDACVGSQATMATGQPTDYGPAQIDPTAFPECAKFSNQGFYNTCVNKGLEAAESEKFKKRTLPLILGGVAIAGVATVAIVMLTKGKGKKKRS